MAKLEILIAPDPRLKQKAKPVTDITDDIKQTLSDMLETMYAAPGVGLAATQVGIAKRMIVVDVANTQEGEEAAPYKLINPEVLETSEEISVYEEGCLSLPDFYEDVERPATCTVKALDENGKDIEIKAEGLLATCLLHEIDHLDGIIFVDHVSRLKRTRILKKLEKLKKLGAVFHKHLKEEHGL